MAEMVTLRNVSDGEVVVGFWLRLPGETVRVDMATAKTLVESGAFAPVHVETAEAGDGDAGDGDAGDGEPVSRKGRRK